MKYFALAAVLVGLFLACIGGVAAYIAPWRREGRAIEVSGVVLFVIGCLILKARDA